MNYMTPAAFLRIVTTLWGDHWQKPCQIYLAEKGYPRTRQALWNYKKGERKIDPEIAAALKDAKKQK